MFSAVSLQDLGLSTVWDDHLCYILTPALSAYETERLTGLYVDLLLLLLRWLFSLSLDVLRVLLFLLGVHFLTLASMAALKNYSSWKFIHFNPDISTN